jgi:hypothetical protein
MDTVLIVIHLIHLNVFSCKRGFRSGLQFVEGSIWLRFWSRCPFVQFILSNLITESGLVTFPSGLSKEWDCPFQSSLFFNVKMFWRLLPSILLQNYCFLAIPTFDFTWWSIYPIFTSLSWEVDILYLRRICLFSSDGLFIFSGVLPCSA